MIYFVFSHSKKFFWWRFFWFNYHLQRCILNSVTHLRWSFYRKQFLKKLQIRCLTYFWTVALNQPLKEQKSFFTFKYLKLKILHFQPRSRFLESFSWGLPHFGPMFRFYTISGGIEMKHWAKMGQVPHCHFTLKWSPMKVQGFSICDPE